MGLGETDDENEAGDRDDGGQGETDETRPGMGVGYHDYS